VAVPPKYVFVSSTAEDLKPFRKAAHDAAIQANFFPVMMEYFAPDSSRPTVNQCLEKVSNSAVVVAIVAARYGWVPSSGPDRKKNRKSITWLECEHAIKSGLEVLAFVPDKDTPWPAELTEEFRVVDAIRNHRATPELLADVQECTASLSEFRKWLGSQGIWATFTTPEDLCSKMTRALYEWKERHESRPDSRAPARKNDDPTRYLDYLRHECSYIDIRGIHTGRPEAQRISLESLYMTLRYLRSASDRRGAAEAEDSGDPLELTLQDRCTAILGDPGSGKTTFLRRIALITCQDGLNPTGMAKEKLGLTPTPFPLFARIADLAEHVSLWTGKNGAPKAANDPEWLPHYFDAFAKEHHLGLTSESFTRRLHDGTCIVLLDGLDEARDKRSRTAIARLVQNMASEYSGCRFLVTSRPPAYAGSTMLADFKVADIQPLDRETIRFFLSQWSERLFNESAEQAQRHRDELIYAVESRPEIAKMGRNPVMLTALAVLHWHEKKLPNQRAELYESILSWLAKSREKPGGIPAELCLRLLQSLAFAMLSAEGANRTQAPFEWAAECIAQSLRELSPGEAVERARTFLENAETDSGIIVKRGQDVRFWHLTFEEYLAARAVAAKSEQFQREYLTHNPARLYSAEWREAVLLFAGRLHSQGVEKVDGLYTDVLDGIPVQASLADHARCAALLGAISRDLEAVHYKCADRRYEQVVTRMLEIFAEPGAGIDLRTRFEAAEALGLAGDPRLRGASWVGIEGGQFRMGAHPDDSDAMPNEMPPHLVRVPSFEIGKYPVTVTEFRAFVDAGGYRQQEFWREGGWRKTTEPAQWDRQLEHPNSPVTGVSWYEAAAYAAWAGHRLLTEEEWEFAARGPAGRRFPWGEEPPDDTRANFGKHLHSVSPVGLFPRGSTPGGVCDIAGNVWEWVSNAFYSYGGGTVPPHEARKKILRGGSYQNEARFLRASDRVTANPNVRYFGFGPIGFRCAR
jgi:formylglycine-generating enzyme required for sulfatase activity